MIAFLCFLLYVCTTLFLGTSVKESLGMVGDEGFFSTIHYYSLPFLVLSVGFSFKKIKFTNNEIKLFLLLGIYFLIAKIIGRSANLGVCFNILVEPVLMLVVLRTLDVKQFTILKILLFTFFYIECGLALYEAMFNTIVFAQNVEVLDFAGNIRAYSLHGHPLQNAFIVCMLSVVFLVSKIKTEIKYGLFILGLLAVFTFNTRSSIYIMSVIMIICIFKDYLLKHGNVIVKSIDLLFLVIMIYYSFEFIMSHSLGTRLSTGLTAKDGSSMARFVLVNVLFMIPLDELFLGVDALSIKIFMYKYGLIAIENSIISLVFYCGALFTMCYIPLMFKEIYLKNLTRFAKVLLYGTLLLLLNVNNALVTDSPVLVIPVLALFVFLNSNNKFETK